MMVVGRVWRDTLSVFSHCPLFQTLPFCIISRGMAGLEFVAIKSSDSAVEGWYTDDNDGVKKSGRKQRGREKEREREK